MRFKEAGLIRAGGVSNFELPELKAALSAGPIASLQSRYYLFQREVESELLPFCVKHQIHFIPWGPLAFGLLGGQYPRNFKLPENDWRHRSGIFDPDSFADRLDVVDTLKLLAEKKKASLPQLAICWLLSQPIIGSVIAGAKRPEQVKQNTKASFLKLSQEEIAQIDALTDRFIIR